MYAVLTNLYVSKTGFLAHLMRHSIEIEINHTKIKLKADSTELFYSFKCTSKFTVSVSIGGKLIESLVNYTEDTLKILDFSFDDIFIRISLSLLNNSWKLLDQCIDQCGKYKNKTYYIEPNTLESSYNNTFTLQKQFPTFSKIKESLYVDFSNKFIIKSNPSVRKAHILDKVKHLLADTIQPLSLYASHKVLIDRNYIFENAWDLFLPSLKTKFIHNILISFKNEIGEDQGALRREFIFLLFEELVNSQRICIKDGIYDINPEFNCSTFIYYYKNRNEQIDVLNDIIRDEKSYQVKYCILLGATIGLMLIFSETFQINFSLIFYENLLSRKYKLKHLQDIELQRNLSLTNNEEYIYDRILEPKKNHYDFIKFGFDYILDSTSFSSKMSEKFSSIFTAFDLPFIFYNFEPISASKLKKCVGYIKCSLETKEIEWFWKELDTKEPHFISKLLLFTTGSGNLTNLPNEYAFVIEKTSTKNELFRSSACIKRLYISNFDSSEKLANSLEMSIMNAEGFHFV